MSDGGPDIGGQAPTTEPIEASAPEEFGLVQVWWGNGKGKTTAAIGMGFRAAGHGYRVHMLQFMKGGTNTVEDVRGEYNAIGAVPGFSYENAGHYGWHGFGRPGDEDEHAAQARGALARVQELLDAAADAPLDEPLPLDGDPTHGMHMLILDEVLYAADRRLINPEEVIDVVRSKPERLELVLTGSHDEPSYLTEEADLISHISKSKHPLDAGQPARQGTEY